MIKQLLKRGYRYIRKLRAIKRYRNFKIDGFKMDMGENHSLPDNMNTFPMYDRFVPFLGILADKIKTADNHIIIDIGANVGDTVAALIKHTDANVICVEPTKQFYDLCEKNINSFGEEYSKRIKLIQAYVAQQESEAYRSSITEGTAVKIKISNSSAAEAPTKTIPQIVRDIGANMHNISLIKVDTDGYDASCILSLGDSLKGVSPLLYWENQINNGEQCDKFIEMVGVLNDMSYECFFVFDNFGNFQCMTDSQGMKDIIFYLWRIMKKKSARSYYYVDVLACKGFQKNICRQVINDYLSQYNMG